MANKEYDENIISDPDKGYFAAKPAKACVKNLEEKITSYYQQLETLGWWDKLRDMYFAYYGAANTSISGAHQITFSGDDEEYSEIVANHLRNIGRNMYNMVTSVRPAWETRSVNTDYKSQVQTKLANGLLDYYMRASGKQVEERLKLACEYGIILGTGSIKLAWNANGGESTNAEEIVKLQQRKKLGEKVKIPSPTYEGDIDFTLLSPFDVVEDLNREDIKQDWKIAKSMKNRYDLISVYPELADELLKINSKTSLSGIGALYTDYTKGETDDIPIWEFYHDRTESVPEGRYILFCNDETIMYDGPLPYRRIPIYSLKPSRVIGTTLGYSDMFDLLPLQDAINMMYSTMLTIEHSFGIPIVLNPSTSNIDPSQLSNGLSVLNYNAQGGKPETLQLAQNSPNAFNFVNFLIQTQETISGINSVTRGNPEASLRSGSAIAMIQANAIQYMSNLQAEYTHLQEDVGLGIVQMLIDFADSPRIADIVGESGKAYVKTFKGEDLRSINRVIVDTANAMTKTIAGRMNMADNLLQYGEITTKQYMNIMNTGNLEIATNNAVNEEMAIMQENEAMMEGDKVLAFYLDIHSEHILGHRALVSDPDMRRNPELLKLVGDHIAEHIELLKTTNPELLMVLGQQPIAPEGAAPAGPEGAPAPEGGPVQEGGPAPEGPMAPNPATLSPEEQAIQQTGAEPQAPGARLPEGFEDAPLTPEANLARMQGA